MSTITQVNQTRNQLHADYSVAKLALGGNEFVSANYTASGNTTLAEGLVLGKVASTGVLGALNVSASDGLQFPYGVLYLGVDASITIANGVTQSLTLINKGRVALANLSFPGGVTINSVISGDGRTVGDYLNALGLIMEGGTELTNLDNQ